MANLLDGIRVVDCTQALQGGAIGCVLGDLGADVIKVEEPQGDLLRNWSRVIGVQMDLPGGRNVAFESVNRNKRSITLNLRSDEGKEILHQLIAQADVFVTNYRRSGRERLGLDYEVLSAINPRLVYGVASAYGERGPSADERAYDNVAFARSGMMHCVGEADSPPLYMTPGAADQLGGTMLAFGIVGALFSRERTGKGQLVESSLLGSLIHILTLPFSTFLLGGRVPRRPTRRAMVNPLIGWYQCADGGWIMFSLNRPQEVWHSFCEALGLGDEVELDPRFNSTRARAKYCEQLIPIFDRAFAKRDLADWLEEFRGRGMICAPVNRVQDILHDTQITDNNYLVDVDHPVLGPVKMVGLPLRFSAAEAQVRSVAPELGQHTEEILLELGYSWDQIADLRTKSAV